MKKLIYLVLILEFISCTSNKEKKKNQEEILTDNLELIEIYNSDQADRKGSIDWSVVWKKDSLREVRVYQLLDSGKVKTSNDFYHAAMVFQHGRDSVAYEMAVKLIQRSMELDSTRNKWLLAAAIDRYLLSKEEPQIYGTQYQKPSADAPWQLGEIDTTKITDDERIAYGVETLAQQRETVKRMNRRKLAELLQEDKIISEIIEIIKQQDRENSEFDISENGINNFGYHLMSQSQNTDASKIFKLNTELYPNGFNTWDSYGECLMILGEKEEAMKAYKKSLELNPENENAREVIEQNS